MTESNMREKQMKQMVDRCLISSKYGREITDSLTDEIKRFCLEDRIEKDLGRYFAAVESK